MFRAIVFDLDHTLFDRYGTLRATLHAFYNHYREIIPEDISLEEFIEKLIEIEQKYIHYDWIRVLQECANEGIIGPMTDEEVKQAVAVIVNECWPIAAVKYPFTIPTLLKLKEMGYKLGVITNGRHEPQALKIKMLELEDLFDEVVISGDVGAHKPSPVPFEAFAKKIGIAPKEMVYVGDHPLNDIEGSRNAGYTPVWVKTINHWLFEDIKRADYEINTVAGLPELLKRIDK